MPSPLGEERAMPVDSSADVANETDQRTETLLKLNTYLDRYISIIERALAIICEGEYELNDDQKDHLDQIAKGLKAIMDSKEVLEGIILGHPLTEMHGMLSHKLNNLLIPVIGNIGLLAMESAETPMQGIVDILAETANSLCRLGKTINPHVESETSRPINDQSLTGNEVILIVDDEAHVRKTVCSILEKMGYVPLSVSSGAAAIQLLPVCVPHAIICDLLMPGMSGFDFYEATRKMNRSIPFVFISGYSKEFEALPSDATFVGKPFTPVQIVSAVRLQLDKVNKNRFC